MRILNQAFFSALGVVAFAASAQAQSADPDPSRTAPPTAREELPPVRSDTDPAPPVARPDIVLPPGGVVEQAGRGGDVGYGRAGVLELGGSAGFVFASDFRNINISPSIGWFLADNFQLSAIFSMANVKADGETATVFSTLVEPSYHLPFNRTMFAFAGMGMGGSYVTDLGAGFTLSPRLGANFLVGRSGILTPSVSYDYTTHSVEEADRMGRGVALAAISSALRVNVGYTVMW